MDDNIFFREATLRICSSLNLNKAMASTIDFLRNEIPVDGLLIGIYDPDLHIGKRIVSIVPDNWPKHQGIINVPEHLWEKMKHRWVSDTKIRITNNPEIEDPELMDFIELIWPPNTSQAHMFIELEKRRLAAFTIAANGKNRYKKQDLHKIALLNEPLAIAVVNYLQYEETLRLQEMLTDDNQYLYQELIHLSGDTIIGADSGLKPVMEMIHQVSSLSSPVLLLGETGVGKEVIANAIHTLSTRRDKPFIKVNCGGLTESLLDSELFGHEKGAFTGAITTMRGRFERAHTGTIFLDEIGELTPAAQIKLLRVLQHKEIERVGGSKVLPVDVRIISATHRNLEEMVKQNKFREDLWFRLNVYPVTIPPLRQRTQDIPALVNYFITKKSKEMKRTRSIQLAPGAINPLMTYKWPGNIRELQNLVERALIRSQENQLLKFDLLLDQNGNTHIQDKHPNEINSLDNVIKRHIEKAVHQCNGRIEGKKGAAQLLRIHPSTLRGKMRKLNISVK